MDKVRTMIVRLISHAISVKEFEDWVYNDKYINSHILDDEDILELLTINLNSKLVRYELEKYLYTKFNEEDCLIEQVKINCEVLVSSQLKQKDFELFLYSVSGLHDWDKDYELISHAHWFGDEWSLAMDGYIDISGLETEVLTFAEEVLERLSKADKNGMIQVLNEGIEVKLINEVTPTLNETISSNNISVVESETKKTRD